MSDYGEPQVRNIPLGQPTVHESVAYTEDVGSTAGIVHADSQFYICEISWPSTRVRLMKNALLLGSER